MDDKKYKSNHVIENVLITDDLHSLNDDIITHEGISYKFVAVDESGNHIMEIISKADNCNDNKLISTQQIHHIPVTTSSVNSRAVFLPSRQASSADGSVSVIRNSAVNIPSSRHSQIMTAVSVTGDTAATTANLFSCNNDQFNNSHGATASGQLVQGTGGQLFLMMNASTLPNINESCHQIMKTISSSAKLEASNNNDRFLSTARRPHYAPQRINRLNLGHSGVNKEDKRRVNHNEVERRRRDKINTYLTELAEMMPSLPKNTVDNSSIHELSAGTSAGTDGEGSPSNSSSERNSRHLASSKGVILKRAVEFFRGVMSENEQLRITVETSKHRIETLEAEILKLMSSNFTSPSTSVSFCQKQMGERLSDNDSVDGSSRRNQPQMQSTTSGLIRVVSGSSHLKRHRLIPSAVTAAELINDSGT